MMMPIDLDQIEKDIREEFSKYNLWFLSGETKLPASSLGAFLANYKHRNIRTDTLKILLEVYNRLKQNPYPDDSDVYKKNSKKARRKS